MRLLLGRPNEGPGREYQAYPGLVCSHQNKVILFSIFTYYTFLYMFFVWHKTYKSPLYIVYCPPGPLPLSKGIPRVEVKRDHETISPQRFVAGNVLNAGNNRNKSSDG